MAVHALSAIRQPPPTVLPAVSPSQESVTGVFDGFSEPPSPTKQFSSARFAPLNGSSIAASPVTNVSSNESTASPRPASVIYNPRPQSVILTQESQPRSPKTSSRPTSVIYNPRPQSLVFAQDVVKPLSGTNSGQRDSGVSFPSKLIVGVDFGTTYSGVAIVHSALQDEVEIIKSWPGGNGITSDKVPTEITYEPAPAIPKKPSIPGRRPSKNLLDSHPRFQDGEPGDGPRWGFQVKPEEPRLHCLKLFLDRNQQLPGYVNPLHTAAHLRKHQKNVMDAVTDYLTKLQQHTTTQLCRRYGDNFRGQTKVEYVLTVPAVWSDAAKNATLLAAERAGMGTRYDIKLISEPEAAALYTLKTFLPSFIQVGHNLIVCDAGGGTVDIIAYRVTQRQPLKIEESAIGTGSLCGSTFLNYRFEDHVKQRLGEARYQDMKDNKPRTWQMALKYFEESVKRNFNEAELQDFSIPMPGIDDDEEAGVDGGFLILTAEDTKDIFDPIVNQVIGLVEGQVDAIVSKDEVVSAVILVGGFGQSNYLYTKLKSHFNRGGEEAQPGNGEETPVATSRNIEVVQPLHAWTAVVRGACLRGLEGSIVVNRRSRWHYGTSYATVFDEMKHPIADRYWSPLWERWMVSDRMAWHIAKGARVSERTAISFHYTRNFRWGQSLIVEDELIASDADTAPESFNQNLIRVCTLKTDLSAVPKHLFTRLATSNGVEFENLDFTLDMMIDSASIVFELKVNGVRYGQVTAEFH